MTLEESRSDPTAGGGQPRTPNILIVATDFSGHISSIAGRWPGVGIPRVSSITDLVHTRNHDLVEGMLAFAAEAGSIDQGVGVQILGADGWDEAVATVGATSAGAQWCFVPALPDPVRPTAAAVANGRDIATTVETALEAFGAAGPLAWATVHYGADGSGRYKSMVGTSGRDTFLSAVEAAVVSEGVCPWDEDLGEEPRAVDITAFGDGIQIAASHAGVASCQLLAIPASPAGDAGCLAIWSETVGLLDRPDQRLLTHRVMAALTLAFQIESGLQNERWLATRDGLTGLWNRQAFFAQLKTGAAAENCSVVCIDVDDFRAINDWHGHGAGDDLLIELATRLRQVIRPGDIVARVSADEFAVLCQDAGVAEAATAIGQRVLDVCREPFSVGGGQVDVDITVGIAVAAPERTGNKLFDAAERTMLEAKEVARGAVALA